jgi:hypothetical protein
MLEFRGLNFGHARSYSRYILCWRQAPCRCSPELESNHILRKTTTCTNSTTIYIINQLLSIVITPGLFQGQAITNCLLGAKSFLRSCIVSPQLVRKCPAFCGKRRFTTTCTRARLLSVSWARSIQSMPCRPTSWRSILINYYYGSLSIIF